MTPPDADSVQDDPRLMEAAREYLADLEAGRKPDRQAFLQRHQQLGDELAECLDGIELAHGIAGTLVMAAPPQIELTAGTLGDFRIVREIGRGGMGVVYEAVQISLGRRIALKVLPFAAALDAKHLQRFKTEAHAAAQLHHQHIVPVHAVGCDRGVHFYAMQLIEGRALDAVIHELRGDGVAGQPGGSTVDVQAGPTWTSAPSTRSSQRSGRQHESYRTAARIAAQVADALEYAHEAGVIHRDIKPANLLLDAKGNVWVTDFGLAHVLADVGLTQTGEMVGTLRYMSPEQAAGQRVLVDHRADVYSLGATLYELLTLQPIFNGTDRRSLLYQIMTDEPLPLRSVNRSIPAELETIVLKAVAKAPEDRYATAAEMAADLRRFLDDRPILARRPSLADRTRKWMRRHPSLVGSAVLLLAVISTTLAVSTAVVLREQRRTQEAYASERKQKAEAEEASARERERADVAEHRLQLAQRVTDDMMRIAEDEVPDEPRLQGLRKRLLEVGLEYYEEFIDQRRDTPDAQAKLEATRQRVEKIVADLDVLQAIGQLDLLKNTAVLDDLSASPQQRTRISSLSRQRDEQGEKSRMTFPRSTQEQRRQQFLENARANDASVRAILTAQQLHRLQQIALQQRKLGAFREPAVIAALRLTAEQRHRIRGIEFGLLFRKGSPPYFHFGVKPGEKRKTRPGGSGTRPGDKRDDQARKQQEEHARKVAMERALAVLTKDQTAMWQEMTGKPFKGTIAFPPFGPCLPGKTGSR